MNSTSMKSSDTHRDAGTPAASSGTTAAAQSSSSSASASGLDAQQRDLNGSSGSSSGGESSSGTSIDDTMETSTSSTDRVAREATGVESGSSTSIDDGSAPARSRKRRREELILSDVRMTLGSPVRSLNALATAVVLPTRHCGGVGSIRERGTSRVTPIDAMCAMLVPLSLVETRVAPNLDQRRGGLHTCRGAMARICRTDREREGASRGDRT